MPTEDDGYRAAEHERRAGGGEGLACFCRSLCTVYDGMSTVAAVPERRAGAGRAPRCLLRTSTHQPTLATGDAYPVIHYPYTRGAHWAALFSIFAHLEQ